MWEKIHNAIFKGFEFTTFENEAGKNSFYLSPQKFERLKTNEAYQQKLEWHANRLLTKVNYLIHTDAIKNNIVPNLTDKQKNFIYAEEADVLM